MEKPVAISRLQPGGALRLISGLFWMILASTVMLALLIILLPQQVFLAMSNYLQIITALGGAAAIGYLYFRCRSHDFLPYAAGAFALWGISNIAWYVSVAMGMRDLVFPSLIDIGIIASILILMTAYQNGLPRKPTVPYIMIGFLVFVILISGGIVLIVGLSIATFVTFLYFFACGSLIITALSRGLPCQPFIFIGTLLFAIAFLIYPVRELFFPTNPLLSVIGTFVAAGLALIVLGIIRFATDTAGNAHVCH